MEKHKQSPWELPYGGLPDAGGYSCNKEYEIGAQKIGEALHCILGSLKKIKNGASDWPHIEEETGIINKALQEYSKDIYLRQLECRDEYTQMMLSSIKKASPALIKQAKNMKDNLPKDMPELYAAASSVYDVAAALGKAMAESVKTGVVTESAFKDEKLKLSVRNMENQLSFYRDKNNIHEREI
jgi:hypothetical protein